MRLAWSHAESSSWLHTRTALCQSRAVSKPDSCRSHPDGPAARGSRIQCTNISQVPACMPSADTAEGRAKAGKHRRTGSWFTRSRGGDEEENYRCTVSRPHICCSLQSLCSHKSTARPRALLAAHPRTCCVLMRASCEASTGRSPTHCSISRVLEPRVLVSTRTNSICHKLRHNTEL